MFNSKKRQLRREREAIRAHWVAALRSGDFKQGRGALHAKKSDTYCCIGVLCELAVTAGIVERDDSRDSLFSYYNYDAATIPLPVAQWVGANGTLKYWVSGEASLIGLNDNAYASFNKIADVIESGNLREYKELTK